MENLKSLLRELERITLHDISEIPEDRQHEVADAIEHLQDLLRALLEKGESK